MLAQSNWTIAELEAYDRYLDAIRSSGSQLDTAKEEGRLEGKIEGKTEEKTATAKKLLTRLDSSDITQITGSKYRRYQKVKRLIKQSCYRRYFYNYSYILILLSIYTIFPSTIVKIDVICLISSSGIDK